MVVGGAGATVTPMSRPTAPFGSLLTASITPFAEDGSVDYEAFWRLLHHLEDTGTEGVVVCGTTGESPTLAPEEKLALFASAVDAVGDRIKIIAGTGTYNTAESVEMTKEAAVVGCHGVMAVTPYYSKPPQHGLHAHFTAIADATDLPVLLYNIPGRTARLIEVETLAALADHPNIVAVKDAVDDITYTKRALEVLPDTFAVYAGSDFMTKAIMDAGGVGVVSVASHVVGRQIAAMIESVLGGDDERATSIDDALTPVFEALFLEPNPMPVKEAVDRFWGRVGAPRLPLVRASDETMAAVEAAMTTATAV